MLIQLLFAFGLTSLTVAMHALGTLGTIAYLSRGRRRREEDQGSMTPVLHILCVVAALLALHWVEAAVWAIFYLVSGAMPDLETATYFSFTSYTTLGYGDVVLPGPWRLLGPFEAAVGILMFGWSTGIMAAAITRIVGGRPQPLGE